MGASQEAGGRGRKLALIAGVLLVMLALIGTGVWLTIGHKSASKNKPPKLTLLTPPAPPPPPPPPPKFEKKPDPPKEQKEMRAEQPVVPKVEQIAAPELKMDGPAGDGPSGFASGNITSDDLSRLGTGKGGVEKGSAFTPYTGYGNQIKGELQRLLAKNAALKRRNYVLELQIWVSASGALQRFDMSGSSGDADLDEAIKSTIASLAAFSSGPPPNMPQPIRLRITKSG